MKFYGEMEVYIYTLTSALDTEESLASGPGALTPRKETHGTHWMEGWVESQNRASVSVQEKISLPTGKWTPII